MPAKSKKQQEFMGMVRAVQEGKLSSSKVSARVRKVARTMKASDVKHFAETKRKGLPEKIRKKKGRQSSTGKMYT